MAEQKAEVESASSSVAPSGPPKLLFLVLAINMAAIAAIGIMQFMDAKRKAAAPGIEDVIKGEAETQHKEAQSTEFIGKLVPLETFLVNLSGSKGRRLLKVTMELEVNGGGVQEEIQKIKPKIREMVLLILSSKTYAQVSTKDGKEIIRDEIRDQVNLFLTKGQIKNVYFTDFIFN